MKPLSMILVLTANIFCCSAQAGELPSGGVVSAGSASIAASANAMVVNQGSNRAIINWNSFSVGAGNTVQFVQPSSSAAMLNRVVAANPSQIHGQITANGRVFLANPSGIVVGPSGRVDASGIFLTTASIADADFMAGNLRFETPPAETPIVIAGALNARYVLNIHAGTLDVRDGAVLNAHTVNVNTEPFSEVVELTVTGMSALGRVYDGTTVATLGGGTLNGLVAGDVLSFSGQTGTFADGNVGIAKSVTVTGIALTDGTALASNYSVRNPTGLTADISPLTLSITGLTASNKIYDSGAGVATSTVTALPGDVVTLGQTGAFANKNTGTGKLVSLSGITLSSADAGNLVSVSPLSSAHATITKSLRAAPANPIPWAAVGQGRLMAQPVSGSLVISSNLQSVAPPRTVLPDAPAVATPATAAGTTTPVAPMRRASPAGSTNTAGLVDGAVTVRLSLVDPAPIALR